ncbi:MAG TPA: transposase [Ktedonobacterales bacterium]|nr:transposase [Ktedonobacterales bacterium]
MEQQGMRKPFKYKLKPTPEQERLLEHTLMRCRHIYNAAVGERHEAWRMRGITVTYYQQKAELPGIKEAMPEYGEVHSQALQDVVLRVERAFQAYFQRLREGTTPGYPRFHGRNRYTSFTYPQFENGARLDNGFLVLSKIGRVAVRWSRPIKGSIKTVTISREADGWHACFSCAEVPIQPLRPTGQETGIDLGLPSFATLEDGTMIHNPRFYRKAEAYLRRCQRRVARRKLGIKRRKKAVELLAKAHLKVKRQRQDFHQKAALSLVRAYDTISYEDLQTANMLRNHSLAKSIGDAGWSAFLSLLVCKAAYAGKQAVAVPPAFTTQDCSGVLPDGTACPERIQKALSVRTHVCPRCGLVLDRDQNAALTILRRGRRERGAGQGPQASTWGRWAERRLSIPWLKPGGVST